MRGLYIHIPFCSRKCDYCDFVSYQNRNSDIDKYLSALEREAFFYRALHGSFDTVYIGGGTPSLLSAEQLKKLFSLVKKITAGGKVLEFTIEVNPEGLTEEKAEVFLRGGVNRISMGLQSSKPELLEKIGRKTSPQLFLKAWKICRLAGFKNMSADLMTGLPLQTLADFKSSMDFLLNLQPEHISLYPLEIHEGTALKIHGESENPNAAADMYEQACNVLPKAGLNRYEISNFSRAGFESKHNLHYWRQQEYLGLGLAASSYIKGRRWTNTEKLEVWLCYVQNGRKAPRISEEKLTGKKKEAEKIMLGLRLAEGIEISSNILIEFEKELSSAAAREMLEIKEGRIKLRPKMFYLANRLFLEFI